MERSEIRGHSTMRHPSRVSLRSTRATSLMVYAKAQQEDMTPDEKRTVRKLVGILKS
jgi:hypothetical protein